MKNRLWNKFYAWVAGYFWLPCPVCGRSFGGHEWKDIPGHQNSVPTKLFRRGSHATGICPDCTKLGVGDRAWKKAQQEFELSCAESWEARRTD